MSQASPAIGKRPHWRIWIGLVVLCLVAGSGIMLDDLAPSVLPVLPSAAARDLLVAALFATWVLCSRDRRARGAWGTAPQRLELAACGAVILAGLPLSFAAAGTRVPGGTELVLFAFLPALVVFLRAQRESGLGTEERGSLRLLVPALAGLGGAGLLIYWSVPAHLAGDVWLAVMAAVAGLAAFGLLRLETLLGSVSLPVAGLWVCLGAALVTLVAAFAIPQSSPWGVAGPLDHVALLTEVLRFAVEAFTVPLSLFLLRGLGAEAYSARYLLVLLVALAESFLVARARLGWATAVGACLMLGASLLLLRERRGAAPDASRESHSR